MNNSVGWETRIKEAQVGLCAPALLTFLESTAQLGRGDPETTAKSAEDGTADNTAGQPPMDSAQD